MKTGTRSWTWNPWGQWKLKLELRWHIRHWAIGLAVNFWSWANAYPWFGGGIYLGPAAIELDVICKPPGELII